LQVFGAAGRLLVSPRLSPLREALRAVTSDAPRLTGNAAALLAANWPAGARPPSLVERRDAPDIDWVAQLGAAAAKTDAAVKPFYMRPPDARPQDASRLARR
jgi:tRNA threonylcarbamoyladenosine biosynthesis protein TsaB